MNRILNSSCLNPFRLFKVLLKFDKILPETNQNPPFEISVKSNSSIQSNLYWIPTLESYRSVKIRILIRPYRTYCTSIECRVCRNRMFMPRSRLLLTPQKPALIPVSVKYSLEILVLISSETDVFPHNLNYSKIFRRDSIVSILLFNSSTSSQFHPVGTVLQQCSAV